jgi:lipopolysaccharide heptosyltransferase II
MASRDWNNAKNILCVRLDSAGDVLMTTPALRALKESRRGRRITLLTSSPGADIARLVPVIDDVIVYDAPWIKNDVVSGDSTREYAMARRLRRQRFDAAVIFCVFSQNPLPAAFLCHLADIPLRLGYCRENPYRILTDWVPDPEPKKFIRHEVERQLDLVKTIGCTPRDVRFSLRIRPQAHRSVRQMLQDLKLYSRGPSVVIHPGAAALSRRYPPENFAVVADRIIRDLGTNVIFTGTESELDLVGHIRSRMRMPSHSLAGRLDIEMLCALISAANLIITNNTGPAHIAAAVRTKMVDIYALTNPQHTPWKAVSRVLSHNVPCKYCYKSVCPEGHHNCLRLLSPRKVIQAAGELLQEGSPLRQEQKAS